MGCNMILKLHFLESHFDIFPTKSRERIHHDILAMEKLYQGKWASSMKLIEWLFFNLNSCYSHYPPHPPTLKNYTIPQTWLKVWIINNSIFIVAGCILIYVHVQFTDQLHFFILKTHYIYIKIHINIAPTCFGLRPSSGSLHWTWLKLYFC
jgi:hypothetical protein